MRIQVKKAGDAFSLIVDGEVIQASLSFDEACALRDQVASGESVPAVEAKPKAGRKKAAEPKA